MYIGIIGRKNDDKITFNKEIIDVINKYNFIPLGIIVDFKMIVIMNLKKSNH